MRIIYKITNLINNKIYIGKHSNHTINSTYMGSGIAIKLAILKYGIENFKKDIIEEKFSLIDLNEAETYWIKFYESYKPSIGYNRSLGGNGFGEYNNMTIESINRRRENQLKTFSSKEFKEKKRINTTNYYQNIENRKLQSDRIRKYYSNLTDEQKIIISLRQSNSLKKSYDENPYRKEKCRQNMLGDKNCMKNPEISKKVSLKKLNKPSIANRVKIKIDDVIYDCIKDAATYFNVNRNIIFRKLLSNKYPNYTRI